MNGALWYSAGLAEVPDRLSWLADLEQDRFARMQYPKRRLETLLGRWTAKKMQRIEDSRVLGPLNLLVPVINFGLGWLLYDEPMPLDRMAGFAFVWIALIIVMSDRIRTTRRGGVAVAA